LLAKKMYFRWTKRIVFCIVTNLIVILLANMLVRCNNKKYSLRSKITVRQFCTSLIQSLY
jgi:hypothetical protein